MSTRLKSAWPVLYLGLEIKRWFMPLIVGGILLGLSLVLFLQPVIIVSNGLRLLILEAFWFISPLGTNFIFIGVFFTLYGFLKLNNTLSKKPLPQHATVHHSTDKQPQQTQQETEVKQTDRQIHRQRRQGDPKVVVIGGGTGLSVLLRGLKHHTKNITAIVTVADDGGSSGKLRQELGVLPPGDFRNCITALADDESLTTQLFQYRFRSGGLEGHSFGNLFITAMTQITGSFEEALHESGRVLNIGGTILPSTLSDVALFAEVGQGPKSQKVQGESAIPEAKLPIERVYFEPDTPRAFPPALQAILNADLIVAGPGSLYTSVIPNLLVTEIVNAIRASTVPKFYICNVATQPGETDNYTLAEHIQAIEAHTHIIHNPLDDLFAHPDITTRAAQQQNSGHLFNFVLANNNLIYPIPDVMKHLQTVTADVPHTEGYQVIGVDIVDEQRPWRHDSVKLAHQLMDSYNQVKE